MLLCSRFRRRKSLFFAGIILLSVLAACGGGGTSSGDTSGAAPPVKISPPGAPQNVQLTSGDSMLSLRFSPPLNDGGAPVSAYNGSCTADGQTRSVSASTGPLLIDGLRNGTTYTCTLTALNSAGSGPAVSISGTPAAIISNGEFTGNIVLGTPSDTSIHANVYAVAQSGSISLRAGTRSGIYDISTQPVTLNAGQPADILLDSLKPDTRYFYRLQYRSTDGSISSISDEYSFHTARASGSSFVFAIQGDSHPERLNTQFNDALYQRTLLTAAADQPDFYITSGDDFSVDTLDPNTVTKDQVTGRYTLQRPYLGLIGRTAPVFLVNGNHEQAARYLLNGTPDNVAVWAQTARNQYFSQPAPDRFYSGNNTQVPFIGNLRNYFAWTWGDALFVVIDPYWESPVCVDNPFYGGVKRSNLWDITHGDTQYQWLKTTLEQSKARYKFVFAHHVMGTGRGGIELAKSYEWGETSALFGSNRPGWTMPIHQLMVANKVSIFFQGHDHIWVRQQLDGVTYQTLSEPADPNYTLWNADAYLSGDKYPNTGYTRVSVSPTGVKVEYVRTYLPKDEGPGKVSGSVAFSYTLP